MSGVESRQGPDPGGRVLGGVRIAPSGFAVLRTPFLPWERFASWSEDLEAPGVLAGMTEPAGSPSARRRAAVPTELKQALAHDRALLRRRLGDLYRRPEIRDALFLASPDLEEALDQYLADPAAQGKDRVETALVRYFQRMSTRPTPFGLFAGCSLVELGERTDLKLAPRAACVRRSRLDMDYLSNLMAAAAADPAVQAELRLHPNNSLYRSGGRIRYVESRQGGAGRSHHLVSVEPDEYLDLALATAAGGARPGDVVRALLAHDGELDPEEAGGYVQELVTSQLLIPETALPVTGPEVMSTLITQLDALPAAATFADALRAARTVLSECDGTGPGVAPARYRELAADLASLPPSVDLKRLIQVDLWRPAPGATLSTRVTGEILRGVEILQALAYRPPETALDRFRQAFRRRYEDREVPLVDVLDEESGIGFDRSEAAAAEGSPLLAELPFAAGDRDPRIPWRPLYAVLMRRLAETSRSGEKVMRFDPEELRALGPEAPPPLPDAFQMMATVIGAPGADPGLEGDVQIVVKAFVGPSGARLLGRFCHLDDGLAAAVRSHLRQEEALRPDAIYAEIVHLPEGRVGNVLFRPILRDHEIPYLARSGVAPDRQILLDDLLVSLRGNRIVLRSRRLGREVLPRMTNAHNFWSRAIGVYKFLGLLQNQDSEAVPRWDWGPFDSASFLPRVECGRLIFALATWRLAAQEIKDLTHGDPDSGFVAVQEWRSRRDLPRLVQLSDGDHSMPVDLDNPVSVETLRQLLRGRSSAVLEELLPAGDRTPACGPEGRYRHELVVPFVKKAPELPADRPVAAIPVRQPDPSAPVGRRFAPGSEWLFCKLYTGTATADQILREVVAPTVEQVLVCGAADRWFFIRYADPDWHLRLRFRGDPRRLAAEVVPAVHDACASFFADGRIWSLQLDTYEREIERYGGPEGIVAAEEFFQADSEAVLRITGILAGDVAAEARWLLAVHGIDLMLADLGLTIEDRLGVIDPMRDSFWREFHGHKLLKRKLGKLYRRHGPLIGAMMVRPEDGTSGPAGASVDATTAELVPLLQAGCRFLAERTARWRDAAARLRALEADSRLQKPLRFLAGSLAHMHANRILRSAARAHEMVIYDFLCREYRSWLARRR